MWWFLRRGRLPGASFFSNSSTNNNNYKPESRPPRKNYDQLTSNEVLDNRKAVVEPVFVEEDMDSDTSSEADNKKSGARWAPCSAHDRFNNNVQRSHDDFSDDTDYDETLTCNVCDRSFSTRKLLGDHQQKKRHFGCSACDSLFPSLMALEHHKEEFQHWSEDSYCSDSESEGSQPAEDCERLL